GSTPVSITTGDVNGDGISDLLAADSGSNMVSVLLGNGIGATSSTSIQGIQSISGISVANRTLALAALQRIDFYFDNVSSVSGAIGAALSRFSIATATLDVGTENFKAAASRIIDTDIAQESAAGVSTRILQQAATAVLAHADQQPALALQLLTG